MAISRFKNKSKRKWLSLSRDDVLTDMQKPEKVSHVAPGPFDCVGDIEPLHNFDWQNEKPERIYKFNDKYNLTMGTDFAPHVTIP